ncbi:MAG: HAD family hydrolase [Candidatus Obscuribacterales bacterium]|nr:HAD family hydrolase [Candidatus Obscuribacterales bacterium]
MNNNVFPYRLVASDLDDTLLTGGKLSQANRAAVGRIRESGAIFAMASGRILQQMTPAYEELGLDSPVVASNGALVIIPGGEVISEVGLPVDTTRGILKAAVKRNVTSICHLKAGVYVTSKHHWNADCQQHVVELGDAVKFVSHQSVKGLSPYKIIWSAPKEQIDELYALAKARFGHRVEVLHLNDETIEFMPRGVDKAFGLKALAAYYGIDATDAAVFGDGNNDLSMFDWAAMSVCMNHGSPAAMAHASLVAGKTARQDNFAQAVAEVFAFARKGAA